MWPLIVVAGVVLLPGCFDRESEETKPDGRMARPSRRNPAEDANDSSDSDTTTPEASGPCLNNQGTPCVKFQEITAANIGINITTPLTGVVPINLNNDGRTDFYFYGPDGPDYFYESDPASSDGDIRYIDAAERIRFSYEGRPTKIVGGDYNSDGLDDFFIMTEPRGTDVRPTSRGTLIQNNGEYLARAGAGDHIYLTDQISTAAWYGSNLVLLMDDGVGECTGIRVFKYNDVDPGDEWLNSFDEINPADVGLCNTINGATTLIVGDADQDGIEDVLIGGYGINLFYKGMPDFKFEHRESPFAVDPTANVLDVSVGFFSARDAVSHLPTWYLANNNGENYSYKLQSDGSYLNNARFQGTQDPADTVSTEIVYLSQSPCALVSVANYAQQSRLYMARMHDDGTLVARTSDDSTEVTCDTAEYLDIAPVVGISAGAEAAVENKQTMDVIWPDLNGDGQPDRLEVRSDALVIHLNVSE
ncbi:MAG: VCBS repeat-containing protein [Deltaproteobacteria bacterium]|nr:VCBS repeat-containing protein [Deltaproteobacteria bacterium]